MKIIKLIKSLFVVALTVISLPTNAVIEIDENFKQVDIRNTILTAKDFRNDPSFEFAYLETLPFNQNGEIPLDSVGSFWIKLPLKNKLKHEQEFCITTSRFNKIDLYYKDKNHKIIKVTSGLQLPFSDRKNKSKTIAELTFKLRPNSEQDVYIWVRQDIPNFYQYAKLPLTLSIKSQVDKQQQTSEFLLFFFMGAIVLMTIYNLALYFVIKKNVYLFYILNNIFILLFVIAQSGYLDEMFFDSPLFHEKILLVVGNLAFVFYMLFAKSILNFKRYDPPWNNRINISLIIWPFLLLFVVIDLDFIALTFGSIGAIIGYTIVVISCIKAIKAGSDAAKFFLAGNISYYLAILISIFQINHILPNSIAGLTSIEIVEIGTMIQLALFSLTLGAVINVMKSKLNRKELEQEKSKRKEQIRYAHLVEQKNHELEIKVVERTKEIAEISKIIEEKNKDIKDSMNYASRIQNAILPKENSWEEILKDSFCLYLPKDIISGDFYWVARSIETQKTYFAVADCTGHGIPGALLSVIGINNLNRCVNEFGLSEPASILDKLNQLLEEFFSSTENTSFEIQDGMDISLCSIHEIDGKTILEYAGANNPLWIIRSFNCPIVPVGAEKITKAEDGFVLYEFKPNKQPIGKFHQRIPFTNNKIEVLKNDQIYLFSDGFADQFGGTKGKKLKLKNFRNLIFDIHTQSQQNQKLSLRNKFNAWKGNEEQVDDICVIGIRV